jgi:L-fuconolactonase
MSLRVDAHHHLWKIARGDYGWLTADRFPTIHRDFTADELRALLRSARLDKTILVQAAESIAETEFLLAIADREDFVGGVVGWVDFERADAIEQISRLAKHPKLVGLRPMLQDMPDERWILRPTFAPVLQAMQQHDLRFDALIKPRHLPAFIEFAQRYPQLPLVIDHAAKPNIADNRLAEWAAAIRAFATHRHVRCKLSGLATEAGRDWDPAGLQPYVDVLLETFGPQRLMWGSDWPVLLLAGGYQQWLEAAEKLTSRLSNAERTCIFGTTAAQFYGLKA